MGKKVAEGMDDADDGSPGPSVGGPAAVTNPAAEAADAVEEAAQRVAGFINRQANANNPQLAARLLAIHRELSDIAATIEGVE